MKQLNEKELHATEGGLFEVFIIIGITYGMYLQLKTRVYVLKILESGDKMRALQSNEMKDITAGNCFSVFMRSLQLLLKRYISF